MSWLARLIGWTTEMQTRTIWIEVPAGVGTVRYERRVVSA